MTTRRIFYSFIISSFLSFVIFQIVFDLILKKKVSEVAFQTDIILDSVKDRFDLLLDVPLTIGLIRAEHLNNGLQSSQDWEEAAKNIIEQNKEIIGLNILDSEAKIISVYPLEANRAALGKVSQNLQQLRDSFNRGEPYWFSPPFNLFQEKRGFGFYVPIVKEGNLKGWTASMIVVADFIENFRNTKFHKNYHLTIKDKLTGEDYFSSGIVPDNNELIFTREVKIKGRSLEFNSWRIEALNESQPTWYWSVFFAFIIGLLSSYVKQLLINRRNTREQIKNINIILNLTAKDALSHLVDMYTQVNLLGSSGYISSEVVEKDILYITNLIEQIELLETMSGEKSYSSESVQCLEILEEQIQHLQSPMEKKQVVINFDRKKLSELTFSGNSWLFGNSIIRNLLTESIILSSAHSFLDLTCEHVGDEYLIQIHVNKLEDGIAGKSMLHDNRRIEVLRKALPFFRGKLILQDDFSGGFFLKVFIAG